MNKTFVSGLICTLLLGCASRGNHDNGHQNAEFTLEPGAVALVAARHAPEPYLDNYAERHVREMRRLRANSGASKGAGRAIVGTALIFPPLVIFAPLAAAAGAALGGAAGALSATSATDEPTEEHTELLRSLTARSLSQEQLQSRFAARFAQLAGEKPGYRMTPHVQIGPDAVLDRPDYSTLRGQPFDRVLEIAVVRAGFVASSYDAAVELTLRARMVPLKGWGASWEREWTEIMARYEYSKWQAEGAALVEAELERGFRFAAGRMADALLIAPGKQP